MYREDDQEPYGSTLLDHEEKQGLKFKHITTRAELNHLEQANIQEGMLWITRQKTTDILNEAFVRELHRRLFGKVWAWAGNFRMTEKNIGIDPRQISVQLRQLLDDVEYWVEHQTYPSIEIAARFHHKLVYIHLFPNGNGRHSRIMADAVLATKLSHDRINWTGGYDLQLMNERRRIYIDALRAADQGDLEPLLIFVGGNDE